MKRIGAFASIPLAFAQYDCGPAEMMGYGFMGLGWLGMLVWLFFWIAIIAAIIYFFYWVASGGKQASPLETLRMRYAKGELSEAQFKKARKQLSE